MRDRSAALSPLAVVNGLGIGGLAVVVVAVGTLVGWRWSLLLAGLLMVGVSYLTHVSLARTAAVGVAAAASSTKAPPRRHLRSAA